MLGGQHPEVLHISQPASPDSSSSTPEPMLFPLGCSFKLVVLGRQHSGKTSLVSRYVNNAYQEDYKATVGIDFSSRSIFLEQNKTARLQIWDTAGCSRFATLIPNYVRSAAAAIVVFDITDRDSFDSVGQWASMARSEGDPELQLIVVGTKQDLVDKRQISEEEAAAAADEHNATYFEVSSKTGHNVKALFKHLAQSLPTFEIEQMDHASMSRNEAKKSSNAATNQPPVTGGICDTFGSIFGIRC